MSISVAAGLFLAVLIGIAWLQFRLLAYLRKSSIRYRWFELFSCLFLIAIGLVLLTAPRGSSIDFLWLLGGGCILSGAISLEPVLRTRFVRSKILRCSFCNKSQRDVRKLIAGPQVLICDECVDICVTIIEEDRVSEGDGSPMNDPSPESP